MEITPVLIDKFFQGGCTMEEVDAVIDFFKSDIGALEKYAGQWEWDAIQAEAYTDNGHKDALLAALKQSFFKNKQSGAKLVAMKKIYRFVAAAVFIMALAGWGWDWGKPASQVQASVDAKNTRVELTRVKSLQSNWRTFSNNASKSSLLHLPDGSIITLYPNTVIRYPQPFTGGKREIQLSGDAFFEVAKNRQLPFIVTAGKLSTTALGTSFRIATSGQASFSVKLFTGKVVVQSVDSAASGKVKRFLSPGEELRYDYRTLAVTVSKFKAGAGQPPALAGEKAAESLQGDTLRFNSTGLPEVFHQLSVLYNIEIDYSTAAIQGINFTGNISRADELQTVLNAITLMNRLQLTQSGKGFVITGPSNN